MNVLRQRLRAWWMARLPSAERWTLTQRNVYILPTGAGLAFGAMMLVLLLASINYQLNLGYALTFLLAGSALASMYMAHASLRGLTLHVKPVAPCFAGQSTTLELVFTNPGAARHGLGLRCLEAPADQLCFAEVEAQAQTSLSIRLQCEERGRRTLPLLHLESRFPFGLFRAWTVWRPAGQHWVYPQPEHPTPPMPTQPSTGDERRSRPQPGGSDPDDVRPWRRGDSPRQVLWKKSARVGELISRDSREPQGSPTWLDWRDAQRPSVEARLSCLAAWVEQAEARGLPWGLRLPGQELPLAQGEAHRHAALRALAGWTR